MKKIIITIIFLLSLFTVPEIFAENIKVSVSEDLTQLGLECTGPVNGYYDCEVEKWFSSVQKMLGWMIRYATFIISLVWVLFIVINGIMYSIGWDDKTQAKDRIIKSIWGLLLLLLSWVILNAIAPWIYSI